MSLPNESINLEEIVRDYEEILHSEQEVKINASYSNIDWEAFFVATTSSIQKLHKGAKNTNTSVLEIKQLVEQQFGSLANSKQDDDNKQMETPLTRPELDAKLETIEARMDGRIARIEDRFISMEKTMEQIGRTLESQKNTPWKAAAATIAAMIATIIAAAALSFSAFDSGRETATVAAETKQETAKALSEIRQIIQEMKTPTANEKQ